LKTLMKRHRTQVRSLRRAFRPQDLAKGWRMVFAATDNETVNMKIAAACRKKGIWVNVAAPPEAGDVQIPAAIRHGRFCVAFSTGGASAALAKTLREQVQTIVGREWADLAEILAARRERIRSGITDPRRRSELLQKLGNLRWVRTVKHHGAAKTARLIDREIGRYMR
jgi:precorrin-2 dehydrogenase / sirohydrochlorin ferrochelatase